MSEERDVDVMQDTAAFVAELRRLADALESGGEFTIELDGEEVTIPEGALFSIAHEVEDGEVELEFQVTWSLAESDDEEEDEEEEEEKYEDETDEDGDDAETSETGKSSAKTDA